MKVYAPDDYPEEVKKGLEDTSHAPVDLDHIVGGTGSSACDSVSADFYASYATGSGGVGATLPGNGQCSGANPIIPGWCLILDVSSPAFGCAISCNSLG